MPTALDPKHLYHLHIIFESGSLSSAAELLSVSQPTLSRTVSTLETQVGRRLMVRGRSGVVLTEAGNLLAEQGRRIGADLKQADDLLNALQQGRQPTIRLGAGPLLAQAGINDFVTSEIQAQRQVNFQLQIGTARQLVADLLHGRLDIAVMATPPGLRTEHLRGQYIADDHIGLFAGPKSSLIRRNEPADAQLLADAKWLALDAAIGPTSSHEKMLQQLGIPPVIPAVQFNMNIQGLVDALATTDALCFLPANVSRLLLKDTGVREIPLGVPIESREISLWHAADADLNSGLMDTIRKCRAFLAKRLSATEG